MRRFAVTTLIAGAVLFATAGIASASSHGGMPADLSLWQTIKWQFDDFAAHISLTFEAIKLMLVSPSLGWAMLDGALCGDKTHWAHALFDTADHALESFFSTVIILAWIGVEIASRVFDFPFRKMQHRARAAA
jgi:hypothetical protein